MFPISTLCVVIHWGVSNLQAATFIKESNVPPSQQFIANISSIKSAAFGFLHNPCWYFDWFCAKLQLLWDKVCNSYVVSRSQHFTALFSLSWLFNFSVSSRSKITWALIDKGWTHDGVTYISSVLRINLFVALWPVISLCIDYDPLRHGTSLAKVQSGTNL